MTGGRYPFVVGVFVDDPGTARWLLELLSDGRRRARRDAWPIPERVAAVLAALETFASAEGTPVQDTTWISVNEAATLLAVSRRRVRALLAERKLVGRRRPGGAWEVDAADVILRLPEEPSAAEPLGTPPEAA